jgi:hypothetical protein
MFLRFLLPILLLTACLPLQADFVFRREGEITRAFESSQVLPGYRYFYSGPEAEPIAILGIRQDIEFAPGLWKEVDLSGERLRGWMERIDNAYRDVHSLYYGSTIIDRQGGVVGIWYAMADWTHVTMGENGVLTVYTPRESISGKVRPGPFYIGTPH